jgi:hypothetical protein
VIGVLLAMALLAAPPTPAATGTLSPAAFRDRLIAAIQTATHRPTTILDERFRATRADGTELTVIINNAYAQHQADPSGLEAVVARFTRMLDAPGDDGATVDRLVVIVRPIDYLKQSVQPGAKLDNFIPARPMAGDLSLFLAVDARQTIRLAGPKDLKAGIWMTTRHGPARSPI